MKTNEKQILNFEMATGWFVFAKAWLARACSQWQRDRNLRFTERVSSSQSGENYIKQWNRCSFYPILVI